MLWLVVMAIGDGCIKIPQFLDYQLRVDDLWDDFERLDVKSQFLRIFKSDEFEIGELIFLERFLLFAVQVCFFELAFFVAIGGRYLSLSFAI